jgi:hypothetical protein
VKVCKSSENVKEERTNVSSYRREEKERQQGRSPGSRTTAQDTDGRNTSGHKTKQVKKPHRTGYK